MYFVIALIMWVPMWYLLIVNWVNWFDPNRSNKPGQVVLFAGLSAVGFAFIFPAAIIFLVMMRLTFARLVPFSWKQKPPPPPNSKDPMIKYRCEYHDRFRGGCTNQATAYMGILDKPEVIRGYCTKHMRDLHRHNDAEKIWLDQNSWR